MWVEKLVNKIVEKKPNKSEYVFNTGTSVTGISHIGNFREVAIAYFVSRGMEMIGKHCKLLLSFDDFDRFKKVPSGVPEYYNQFIGMPVCEVDNPFGENTFSRYYENIFKTELKELGIDNISFIEQSKNYKEGKYNKYYNKIFKERLMIKSIVGGKEKEEKDSLYFPFHIYCDNCHTDFTKVINIDEKNQKINYSCQKCNYRSSFYVTDNCNIKPIFKIDWPMRWRYEKVDFEPSGKSHMTKGGAYDVATKIYQIIFNENCEVLAQKYEFVQLGSSSNRMSKTSGKILTITNMLKYINRDMLLWLFLKTPPDKRLRIDVNDYIESLYESFECFIKDESKDSLYMKKLLNIDVEKYKNRLNARQICKFISSLLTDDEIVALDKSGKTTLSYVKNLRCYMVDNKKIPQILEEKNIQYFNSLDEKQKNMVSNLVVSIKTNSNCIDSIVCFVDKEKFSKEEIKEFYTIFYNLVLGQQSGPPLKRVFDKYDKKLILKLLEF